MTDDPHYEDIETADQHQPRPYEEICDEGRAAAESDSNAKFKIGDLACEIETAYGGHNIADFAKQINVEVKSVMAYRTVCRFYKTYHREKFQIDNPLLCYTHFRDAMAIGEPEKAYPFLEMVSANGLSVEAARIALAEVLGKGGGPPTKIADSEVSIATLGDSRIVLAAPLTVIEAIRGARVAYICRLIVTACPTEVDPHD
jgi:hypothetical protein